MTAEKAQAKSPQARRSFSLLNRGALLAAVLLLCLPALAQALPSKQPVDFFGGTGVRGGQFGGEVRGLGVNQGGAGAGNPGDIYVADSRNNRIERFARDDHGTPADGSDDTYSFISAWGAGVEPASGEGYEVCTVAESCREGIASGIGGALSYPSGLAVDQDTGNVYVTDLNGARVNVYSGDGTFLRAFGYGVVASGPGDTGEGYEVCVAANGDVCKAGVSGVGLGQIGPYGGLGRQIGIAVSQPDGNPASGSVFLADGGNSRVNTYHLDGSSPGSIGSSAVFENALGSPRSVAIDSRGILYASNESVGGGKYVVGGEIERYDTENANGTGVGFLAPIASGVNEVQQLTVDASAGTFNLTYDGETTVDLPFNVPAEDSNAHDTPGVIDSVTEALIALPSIGGGNLKEGGRAVLVDGGPGDPGGTQPYRIKFGFGLGARDVKQIVAAPGAAPLSGGAGASVSTLVDGQAGLVPDEPTLSLTVDLDSDGLGPDTDVLYTVRSSGVSAVIQQFGPENPPGLTAPPSAFDAVHGTLRNAFESPGGAAVDQSSGRIYIAGNGGPFGTGSNGVYVLDVPSGGPSASLDSLSDVTPASVTAHATITPNGTPALSYRLEYSPDGSTWDLGPTVILGVQKSPLSVTSKLEPPGGLLPNTLYHVRLWAKRPFFPVVVTPELTFNTPAFAPLAQTTGSPVRTATTVRLDSRVDPNGSAATYSFEYGDQGPCDTNPCTATEAHPAGSGQVYELVSQQLEGLEPNTTYHYRVVADNGNPGSPVYGEDITVSTFADDAPLSHRHLPGPVGSDRAWELVSEDDTSGNPVGRSFAPTAAAIGDDGDRVVYGVAGGTPLSETGTFATRLFAERTPSGWKTKKIYPKRDDAIGAEWETPGGASDLSTLISENHAQVQSGEFSIWRLSPAGTPERLFSWPDQSIRGGFLASSDDGSRVLKALRGSHDPDHPAAPGTTNLYDISSGGTPRLVDLLPDGSVPVCGLSQKSGFEGNPERSTHWIAADGSFAFFLTDCSGPLRIYQHNFSAETTRLISGAPYSGPLCDSQFVKSTPSFVYLYTESQLVADDIKPEACSGDWNGSNGDIYRYDLGEGGIECLTCLTPGYPAAVRVTVDNGRIGESVGVSEDDSHLYFSAGHRLLAGSPAGQGTYALDLGSDSLTYVGTSEYISDHGQSAMSRDGSVVAFRSKESGLDAIGGQRNGGTYQDYLYDDDDHSLVCVSCPADGSLPAGQVFNLQGSGAIGNPEKGQGANRGQSLDASGKTFVFSTPTALVNADQNTAGAGQDPQAGNDVYEWRGGRLLLVSDGITNWPDNGEAPMVAGITPSGRDIFFSEAAQLTQDALDGYNRLYDARIGGGFEFPQPPKPCPLEVCQGTPKGAPEEAAPGTASITGAGNVSRPARVTCAKPKRRVRKGGKTRCVKPARNRHPHKRANHDRRTAR